MTEESYQQGRTVMQRANWLRGKITSAGNEIKRYTQLEGHYREHMQHERAEGAKKMILKAIKKKEEWQAKFAELKFPLSNLVKAKEDTENVSRTE